MGHGWVAKRYLCCIAVGHHVLLYIEGYHRRLYKYTAGSANDCVFASQICRPSPDKVRFVSSASRYLSEQHLTPSIFTLLPAILMLSLSPRSVCSWIRSSKAPG
jgi:hypothetical protein